jgi:hypothetical protein
MTASSPDPSQDRPKNQGVENENLRPGVPGKPPRPATEPAGSEGSSHNSATATDPGSGESR